MATLQDYNFRELVTGGPEESAYSAAQKMENRKVGCILVTREDELLGIVTRFDFIHGIILDEKDPRKTKLKEIMHSSPVEIDSGLTMLDALRVMIEKRVERVVVRSGVGEKAHDHAKSESQKHHGRRKILGVISIEDVVASLSNESYLSLSRPKFELIFDMVKRLTPNLLSRYEGEEKEMMRREMNDEVRALLRLLEEAEISLRR
jgi:CBS domain-containing protein